MIDKAHPGKWVVIQKRRSGKRTSYTMPNTDVRPHEWISPGKRAYRKSEVVLHMDGNATNQDLPATNV
jgi:hypothetical protein